MATKRKVKSDPSGAYAADQVNANLDQMINYPKLKKDAKQLPENVISQANTATSQGQQSYSPTGKKTLQQISKETGIPVKELLKNNPQLKNAESTVAEGQQVFLQPTMEEPSIFDKIKDYASRIPGNIKREGSKALEQAGNLPGKAMDFIEKNPGLVGAAANIAGGVGGYLMGQQATDEAFKDIGRARTGYEGVQQQVQGVKANQDLMAARKAAIEGIKQRSEMGLTPEDQAMLRQVQAQQLRQGAAGRQAAEEAASRRGAQGGQDIMAALQAAGQAQQTASEQADRLAATSFQAKQQALKDLATASQTGISGDFSQDLSRAKAAADIQENIGQTYGTEATMQGKKAEQLANLGVKAGEAISTPLMYSAMQKERMEKTPAPEQPKQDPMTQIAQNQLRPELKKDKSVVGQANKAVKKVQDTVSKAQNTVNQAQQLGNLVGQAVGSGSNRPSTIKPASNKPAVPSMPDLMNIFKPKK